MIKQVKVYHNLRCPKSQGTLNLLKENSVESEVMLYLGTSVDAATPHDLLKMLGMNSACELMRQKEDLYKELNLTDSSFGEEVLIQAIIENSKLMERPVVVANSKARIGRPPGQVLEIVSQDVLHRWLKYIAGCDAYCVLSSLRVLRIGLAQVG